MQGKNQPEKHIRFGGVRVSIWKDVRKNANGKSFESRSVTLDRAYKDAQGQWQNTGNLRENDIPKAVLALSKAYEKIVDRGSDDNDE